MVHPMLTRSNRGRQGLARLCGIAAAVGLFAVAACTAAEPPLPDMEDNAAGPSLRGWMLVAKPDIADERFREAVVLIVRHSPKGAMGLVVNRPIGIAAAAGIARGAGVPEEDLKGDRPVRVHYGGPVRPKTGFIVHSSDYAQDGTLLVTEKLLLTLDPQILGAIANGKGPRRHVIALGYSGWGPGQLENEIRREDWFAAPADPAIVLGRNFKTKWERALRRFGLGA